MENNYKKIKNYLIDNIICLNANGTLNDDGAKQINKFLFENGIDAVVDRQWNIVDNDSVNIIGLEAITLDTIKVVCIKDAGIYKKGDLIEDIEELFPNSSKEQVLEWLEKPSVQKEFIIINKKK